MRRYVIPAALGVWLAFASAAHGSALFEELAKDFGSVPRGTMLSHHFKLTNDFQNPLHVASLSTSCVCSTVTIGKTELAPGEATHVLVTVDTRKYAGYRSFNINVLLDRPIVEELRLMVSAISREDVTLSPGQCAFGRIKKGMAPTSSVTIEYRGAAIWEITGIENKNGYIVPKVKELSRGPGQAVYQLNVQLRDDIPIGAWHAEVWLTTNDATTPRIRVPLTVEVEGVITATPSEVAVGRIKPGTKVERKVVLRGPKPFKVIQVDGSDEQFKVAGKFTEAKMVHVLSITMEAGKEIQELSHRFHVLTDLGDDAVVDFTLQAQVAP